MKKRIISIVLVVAMVVAMIPAVLVSAFAANHTGFANGYDVYFSETDPTLDGVMDAVYANSEKVIPTYMHTAGVDYEAYYVVTGNGVYVCANITDSTIDVAGEAEYGAGTGDKAQVYFQLNNTAKGTWHNQYFDFDYAHTTSAQGKGSSAATFVDGGYVIEIFMPWTAFSNAVEGLALETAVLYVGFQVNNYTLSGTNTGLALDCPNAISYWGGDYIASGAPNKLMTKVNVLTAAKTVKEELSYDSFITDETITLDGKRDDVYLLAEQITPKKVSIGTVGETTGFTTSIVGTHNGLYIFASIYDDTLDKAEQVANGLRAQDGDKFQVYLQLGNHNWSRWGYIDFDYVDGGRHLTTKNTLGYSTDDIQQVATIWEDGKGWDIEIFIPNTISADHPQNVAGYAETYSYKDIKCKVNFQALNETCTDWGDDGKATARNRYGLSYDTAAAANAWNGPDHAGSNYVTVDFNVSALDGYGAITYMPSFTMDGLKDVGYGDDSVAFDINKNTQSSCSTHTQKATAKAWVGVTDTRIVAYIEITDPTATEGTGNDDVWMSVTFPTTGTTTYFGLGYLRDGHIHTTSRWSASASNPMISTNGFAHSGTSCNEWGTRKYLGDNKWALELSMDLPVSERYLLAKGEEIKIAVDFQLDDKCGSAGTTACNTDRTGYPWYWQPNASQTGYSIYRTNYTVSKASTADKMNVATKLVGANVALGESITVNYVANVPAHVNNPVMKFTMNDKVTYVPGVATSATEYKFAFEGIAPQHMGDNIKAELYVAGDFADVKATYSVKENVTNVKNDSNKALVEALLHYGAAAQQYTNYKTDALVNAGLTAPTYTIITNTDKVVGAANVNGIKMSAAGVYYANVNKLYVKASLTTSDPAVLGALVANLKVTIDGKEVAYAETDVPGVYVVYTDGIKVTDFDKVFTIEITDGTNTQTLTYSVNAYCAAKQNAANAETAALAKALYAYGVAAENYVA